MYNKNRLSKEVCFVKGIGPKKAKILEKLNIYTLADVLQTYPRVYEDRTYIKHIDELLDGEKISICAVVKTTPLVSHIKKGMDITKCIAYDETGYIEIVYFNNKYKAVQLKCGEEYIFYGKIQICAGRITMISPLHEKCSNSSKNGKIVPIYPLTAGITQNDFERLICAALECEILEQDDPIPKYIRDKYKMPSIKEAVFWIHRPQNMEQVESVQKRVVFEELFLLCCGLSQIKKCKQKTSGIIFKDTNIENFWKQLKFKPTNAQVRAINDCIKDISCGIAMNRLLQGDVGSGKTLVAAALCLIAFKNGYQSAVMAPTEILAIQHEKAFLSFFENLGVKIVLLTGSMSVKTKRETIEQIKTGCAHVVIGTHALIQKDVEFFKLGMVIADEQHRFGVNQRIQLIEKGSNPHTLVMSATPIPRTLALIIYGDLDISIIDELPPNRKSVETYVVGEKMRRRVITFMEKQIRLKGQVYVVCPIIEQGELELKSAEEYAKALKNVLPHRKIEILHGRMKAIQKEEIMSSFANGNIDILVSTTVIEVGVNVPNASLMVVEDANRFGLSQLHQLRGRVGRGNKKSYCILFGGDKGETAQKRLGILAQTNDGFEIAKADLAQRGPGDFFGNRQHGLPFMKNIDIISNVKEMEIARYEADKLIEKSPDLSDYKELKNKIYKMFESVSFKFN